MITNFKSSVDVHSLNENNLSGVATDSTSKDHIAGLISMYPHISRDARFLRNFLICSTMA